MRIALQDIHKHYGTVLANNGISMEITQGSIHGILGENGAGKSTLMKILAGYVRKTSGTISIDGKPREYRGPDKAALLGIGMLYQDPLDFPCLSVLENFMMGLFRGLSYKGNFYRRMLLESAGYFGFHLDPESRVNTLTVGERQQLEILRLLAIGIEVLILDEPTTGISDLQRKVLFEAFRKLAEQGKTILLVSHKLEDIEALCDRVSVLRQGRIAGELIKPFDTSKLLEWMFGSLPPPHPSAATKPGQFILSVENVSAPGGRTGLRNCNVSIRQGEVVGLAGLEGSGQSVFLRLAAGLYQPEKGRIRLYQKSMTGQDYHTFKDFGVTFLPAARLEEGLIPGLTITEHFALRPSKGMMVPWLSSHHLAADRIERFRIMGRPSSVVESLSGGNQQRLLLALMPEKPRLLLLENPTRGLDMESVRWVWERLMEFAAGGASIVFSSPELDEILEMADRVLVFFNGEVVKDVSASETTLSELGPVIAGKV
jgi:simple sugar transport system ATP-binding protein